MDGETNPRRLRILYLGTGEIGAGAFESLLNDPACMVVGAVTQPDRPAGRELRPRPSPIKVLAAARGIPVFQPERIRKAEPIEELRKLAPDIIVVMAYGQILPKSVIELGRLACLNLHASLLPRHRGASPIQAAILSGDRETGITVMHMDEGLDTGDILLSRSIPIRRRETGGTLHDRLAGLAPEALRDALDLVPAGRAPRIPQDPALATHSGKLSRQDGAIRWTRPSLEIERHIRAMNPWPGAFTEMPFTGQGMSRVKVFSAIVVSKAHGDPGAILRSDARGILIAAGSGSVLLREVQIEGRKRMQAGELVRGKSPAHGGMCS